MWPPNEETARLEHWAGTIHQNCLPTSPKHTPGKINNVHGSSWLQSCLLPFCSLCPRSWDTPWEGQDMHLVHKVALWGACSCLFAGQGSLHASSKMQEPNCGWFTLLTPRLGAARRQAGAARVRVTQAHWWLAGEGFGRESIMPGERVSCDGWEGLPCCILLN